MTNRESRRAWRRERRLLFAGVSTVYLLVAIQWEERLLRRAFGGAYLQYVRRVRWRVVPGVY